MRHIIDISRYRPILVVLFAVTALFFVVDVSVRMSVGLTPAALSRADFLNPDLLGWLGGRVSGVARERRSTAEPNKPLAVIVGFSTAREGFVPEVMEAANSTRRWLNLGGSGASFYELSYYLSPFAWSDLNPDLIVVAVHPVFMAGRVYNTDFEIGRIKTFVKESSWFVLNKNRLNISLRRALTHTRERLFLDLGYPLEAIFPPPLDPWSNPRIYDGHADAQFIQRQMSEWERFHWFVPSRYSEERTEIEAAHEVLRECESKAQHVVVVFMPESTRLRTRVPPDAEAAFRKALVGLAYVPPIIDLRDGIPDDDFYDLSHPNAAGRPVVSKLLIEKLAALESTPR